MLAASHKLEVDRQVTSWACEPSRCCQPVWLSQVWLAHAVGWYSGSKVGRGQCCRLAPGAGLLTHAESDLQTCPATLALALCS